MILPSRRYSRYWGVAGWIDHFEVHDCSGTRSLFFTSGAPFNPHDQSGYIQRHGSQRATGIRDGSKSTWSNRYIVRVI